MRSVTISALVVTMLATAGQAFAQPLAAPTLVAPADTSVWTPTPTYTWNAVTGATTYRLWVNDTVQSPKVDITYTAAQVGCGSGSTCSATPAVALAAGPATWWVLALNGAGNSPWSAPRSFGIAVAGSIAKYQTGGGGFVASTSLFEIGGKVGIGMPPQNSLLEVQGPQGTMLVRSTGTFDTVLRVDGGPGDRDPYLLFTQAGVNKWAIVPDIDSNDDLSFYTYLGTPGTRLLIQEDTGNVGIGTTNPTAKLHVGGNVVVDGNIGAKYQDVAEWVDAVGAIPAGTVVVADPTRVNQVRTSEQPYDTAVAGVISAQPGILLGEKGDGKVAVAQSGRVRVKVDASYGAIKPGDLLVTSPLAGYAMRSEAIAIGKVTLHRPGTILGKALEPLESGRSEILVLLTLQ